MQQPHPRESYNLSTLDAIWLSEEELGMLFGPSLHGAVGTPNRKSVRQTPTVKRPGTSTSSNKTKTKKQKKEYAAKAKPNMLLPHVVPARCGYRTGKCRNVQAFKRNGKLHKLCEFHRERANLNQKKLDRKKRMQRAKLSPTGSPTPSSCPSLSSETESCSSTSAGCSPRTVEVAVTSRTFDKETSAEDELDTDVILPTNLHEAPVALSHEELAIFCSLMAFDASHRAPDRRDPPGPTSVCHYYTKTV
ncbi:unnamed protein product [Hyaloperonospora brassicae]|uniref:WRC domain-containing protein n=1 Tax=Hyaloperonospora brassicae TaxID=162125 RepID=A0AAV0V610_HYABA|nr:unnamed protein product [Hyaloperonospora brassicae]